MTRPVRIAVHVLTVVILFAYVASCFWRVGLYTTTCGRAIRHGAVIDSRWPVWTCCPRAASCSPWASSVARAGICRGSTREVW